MSVVVGVLFRVLLSSSLDEDLVQTRGPEEANEGPHSIHASRGSVQTGKGQDGREVERARHASIREVLDKASTLGRISWAVDDTVLSRVHAAAAVVGAVGADVFRTVDLVK